MERRRKKNLSALPALAVIAAALAFCAAVTSLLALTSSAAFGAENERAELATLMTVSTTALVLDWGTTRNMSKRYDEGYSERNPYIGRYPSTDTVDTYFAGLLVLHFVGNYLIQQIDNKELRKFGTYFENGYVTLEHGLAAAGNFRIGLKLEF